MFIMFLYFLMQPDGRAGRAATHVRGGGGGGPPDVRGAAPPAAAVPQFQDQSHWLGQELPVGTRTGQSLAGLILLLIGHWLGLI
jgi:hypothetical protein